MLAGYKEDVLRANLPEFEKKTGIKVLIDASPFADMYKKNLLALSTGGRFDVLFLDEPWVPPLSEFLTPLDERLKSVDMQDFVPTTVASGAFQGSSTRSRWTRTSRSSCTGRISSRRRTSSRPRPGTSSWRRRRPSMTRPRSSTGSP